MTNNVYNYIIIIITNISGKTKNPIIGDCRYICNCFKDEYVTSLVDRLYVK